MSKSKLIFLIVSTVLLIILVGGFYIFYKGGKPEDVTLTFWGVFDSPDQYAGLIAGFKQEELAKKRHPKNITVEYKKLEYQDYEEALKNSWSSGKGPDIFLIHNTWLPKYQQYLYPCPQTQKDGMNFDLYKQSFMPVATQDFTRGGQIYAIPLSIDTLALYYNKDILENYYNQHPDEVEVIKPPANWDEFIKKVAIVTNKDEWGNLQKAGAALGTANNINRASDILFLIMLQTGTKMMSEDLSKVAFGNTTAIDGVAYNPGERSLEFYTSFADPKKKVYTWNRKKDYSIDEFADGDVAMMIGYSYLIGTLEKKSPNLNYGIASVPQITEAKVPVNYANYWGLAVPRFSQNTETAWDFIKFASKRENVYDYLTRTKRPTARRDLVSQQQNDTFGLGVFAKQGLTAQSWYQTDSEKIEKIFLNMIEKVNLNQTTIPRAINDAVKEVNSISISQ